MFPQFIKLNYLSVCIPCSQWPKGALRPRGGGAGGGAHAAGTLFKASSRAVSSSWGHEHSQPTAHMQRPPPLVLFSATAEISSVLTGLKEEEPVGPHPRVMRQT